MEYVQHHVAVVVRLLPRLFCCIFFSSSSSSSSCEELLVSSFRLAVFLLFKFPFAEAHGGACVCVLCVYICGAAT